MSRTSATDLAIWKEHEPLLLGLAYRMLGDRGRAEDMLQDSWIRWSGRGAEALEPRAYLVSLVTRLCLTELSSARARKEEVRSDRLPEPVDLQDGFERVERFDRVSMAFLVVLQRLTPAERAVLLLHDVFDYPHDEVARLASRSPAACRKLLERAREHVASEKRILDASREEHERLLGAFIRAATAGDVGALAALLAEDAVMITDGGKHGTRFAGVRNLEAPLEGAARIAAFVANVSSRAGGDFAREQRELNGFPALVLRRGDSVFAALSLGVAGARIHRIYFQADPERLHRIAGPKLAH